MLTTKFDHPATVIRVDHITALLIVVECETTEPVPFVAGQYLSIVLPTIRPAPFSIASAPTTPTRFEFGIGITGGPVTTALSTIHVGDQLVLRGPFGKFILQGEPKVCLLSGGVGITPFMSMLRYARDTNASTDIVLCCSNKQRVQTLWYDELMTATREHPNLRVALTLTEEKPADWPHRLGRIDEAMLRESVPDFLERTFYACGPPAFIGAMRALIVKLGVPENRFVEEKW